MPRGVTPRQPARTGRQDRVAHTPSPAKVSSKALTSAKLARNENPAVRTRNAGKAAASKKSRQNGYNPVAPERVSEILKLLDQAYPDVTCALTHKSAWELLVATILSAQSTDVNVNRVTPELFRKYPTVEAFAALTPEQLEPDVRSTGFFRNKSKSVVGAAIT
jgi:endonuclease III